MVRKLIKMQTTYKWVPEHRDDFINDVSSNIADLEDTLLKGINEGVGPDDLVNTFTNYLANRGKPYFERKTQTNRINFNCKYKNRQKWYNNECKTKYENYKKALYEFNLNKTQVTRQNVNDRKKDYRYCCRKCKLAFNRDTGRQMNNLRRMSPREFWKIFKQKSSKSSGEAISNREFYDHFKNLMSESNFTNNDECLIFLQDFDLFDNESTSGVGCTDNS